MSTPLLLGELANSGGLTLDAAITPDGQTALVSNFNTCTISFIDTSLPTVPLLSASLKLGFFAEDIAITADGRYALVTDGAFMPKIAVLDIANRSLVEELDENDGDDETIDHYSNAVAVTPDGKTVLTADYFYGRVHVYNLSAEGHLTYSDSIDVSHGGTLRPVNLTISPDGQTAIVAATSDADNMGFPVLKISGAGLASTTGIVKPSERLTAAQSIVFNKDGSKAYLNCTQEYVAPNPEPDPPVKPGNLIAVLNVNGPNAVSYAGALATVATPCSSQLFGVDTLAIDFFNDCLYVSNMSQGGALNQIEVVDLASGDIIKTISFEPVPMGDPAVDKPAIPTGICFMNY